MSIVGLLAGVCDIIGRTSLFRPSALRLRVLVSGTISKLWKEWKLVPEAGRSVSYVLHKSSTD